MPINASVEDYEQAIADLEKISEPEERISKEISRLKDQSKINRQRERQTYGKMFFKSRGEKRDSSVASAEKAGSEVKKEPMSVSEYVEKKFPKPAVLPKTTEDKEVDLEMQKIDREVDFLIQKKIKEFSFHIKDDLEHFPEIDELTAIIDKSIADYKMAKKFNQIEEIRIYIATIKEMKFAKQHLIRVMNMDFSRPT